MKKVILLVVFMSVSLTLYSQNLSWKKYNADVGKRVTSLLQDSLGRLIVQSEKGLLIYSDTNNIKRIDNLLPDTVKITCFTLDTANKLYVGTEKNGVFWFDEPNSLWIFFSGKLENQNIRKITIGIKNTIVVGTPGMLIYRYTWADSVWLAITKKVDNDNYYSILKFNSLDYLICGTNSNLYLNEYVSSWKMLIDLSSNNTNINDIVFNEQTHYISTDNSAVYKRKEINNTWFHLTKFIGNNTNVLSICIYKSGELIALTKDKGVYYSNNEGFSFEQNNDGLTDLNILTGLILKNGNILVSINNVGLYTSEPPKNKTIPQEGWIDKSKYLEIQGHANTITKIKISNDEKRILTQSGKELKIWDINTGYLLSQHYFYYDNIIAININSDDKYVTFVIRGTYDRTAHFYIYNLESKTIIKNLDFLFFANPGSGDTYYFDPPCTEYDEASNSLEFSFRAGYFQPGGGNGGAYWEFGGIKRAFFSDSSTKIQDYYLGPVINYLSSKRSQKKVVITEDYSSQGQSRNVNFALFAYDSLYKKYSYLYKTSDNTYNHSLYNPITHIYLLKLRDIVVGLSKLNNTICYWDLNDYVKRDVGNLPETPIDLAFNFDDKYFGAIFNSTLKFISFYNLNVLDSVLFEYKSGNHTCLSAASNSPMFALGRSDGYLCLIRSNIISSVEDNQLIPNHFESLSISPNPATDYIEISVPTDLNQRFKSLVQDIHVYFAFGEEVPIPNSFESVSSSAYHFSLRLDVSGFVPGVYFVKIGDRVQRFVKV